MFNKNYLERLRLWSSLRSSIETSSDPLRDVVEFYKYAPLVNIQVDPYDPESWLNPWELLHENVYCEFSKILAICYTLQLTDRFIDHHFEIHIITDSKKSTTHYLLFVDNKVIGYEYSKIINKNDLPPDLRSDRVYTMPKLN